jgi:gluconate 5-dehydrogenase
MSENVAPSSDGVVLITGGGTGLGLGIARAFVAAGRRVVIVGRRREVLDEAARSLGALAHVRVADVDALDEAPALVEEVERSFGPVAALVNNAGRHHKAAALEHDIAAFAAVLHTNLTAAFALSQACARPMAARGGGAIVMIASISAQVGMPLIPAYTAAKAGLLGLTRALATEWGPKNIRVNAVCPGFIDSAMFRAATANDPARLSKITGRIALSRFGTTGDVGTMVRFLCSPEAAYVTGAVMNVDGGFASGF